MISIVAVVTFAILDMYTLVLIQINNYSFIKIFKNMIINKSYDF